MLIKQKIDVKDTLEDEDFNVWVDEELETSTGIWSSELEKAIENAQCLLVLMSPDAKDSEWVNRELHYANTQKVHIFPLLALGNEIASIPILLSGAQWYDLRTKYVTSMARVIKVIRSYLNIHI